MKCYSAHLLNWLIFLQRWISQWNMWKKNGRVDICVSGKKQWWKAPALPHGHNWLKSKVRGRRWRLRGWKRPWRRGRQVLMVLRAARPAGWELPQSLRSLAPSTTPVGGVTSHPRVSLADCPAFSFVFVGIKIRRQISPIPGRVLPSTPQISPKHLFGLLLFKLPCFLNGV